MINTLIFDLSWTILFPKDAGYRGELNAYHREHSGKAGYDISDHMYIDEELLAYLKELKSDYGLYIFTSGNVQNESAIHRRLAEVFEGIYSAGELGLSKREESAYTALAEKFGKKPQECVFVDDTPVNVEAAERAGMTGIVYTSFPELNNKLVEVLA